jgi:hypothetical protein
VQAWSENWTPSKNDKITITLSVQPGGQTAAFNSTSCVTGNATATCTLAAPGSTHTVLLAQVQVKTNTTSVTLTATANPAGTPLKTPPAASDSAQVTVPGSPSATASPSATKKVSQSSHPAGIGILGNVPLGPIPLLNGLSSQLVGAGNAAGLFPQISPSAAPSPAPGAGTISGKHNADPKATVALLPLGMPVMTAQIVGLIALALAVLLGLTRMSLLRRPGRHR